MQRELVERAQRGDQEAFEGLVRMSANRLFAIAYRITRDHQLLVSIPFRFQARRGVQPHLPGGLLLAVTLDAMLYEDRLNLRGEIDLVLSTGAVRHYRQ